MNFEDFAKRHYKESTFDQLMKQLQALKHSLKYSIAAHDTKGGSDVCAKGSD